MATNKIKISSRGGARSGAGRPKGGTNKLSGQDILDQIEMTMGRTYVEVLVDNYTVCLAEGDKGMIHQYDKLFLSKVVADKVDIDFSVNDDMIEAKRVAFTDALAAMARKTADE